MKKDTKKDRKKLFSGKDIFVILLSVIALTVLVLIIFKSNESAKKQQEELGKLSEGLANLTVQYKEEEVSDNLVVNEINQGGWVELYNKGNKSIDLSGYSVAVDGEDAIVIPNNTEMSAGNYYVIELGQKLQIATKQIFTIFDAGEEVIVKVMIPDLQSGESYGCISDGSIEKSIMTASKGESNKQSTIITTGKLEFSVPGGFYNENFQLAMTAPEGCSIYYTLDGSEPTADSMEYENPITIYNPSGSNVVYAALGVSEGTYVPSSINKCMVVRAICIDEQGRKSEIKTESYFIGLENASDYVDFPVISIATNPDNLFDYFEGIYVRGRAYEDALAKGGDGGAAANYFNDWKKMVHVEYFEPEKDKTFSGDLNLSIVRDISVTQNQKSLLLENSEIQMAEGSSLKPFFNESSGNIFLQTNKRDNNYKMREYLVTELCNDLEVGTPELSPCILFIDGEYWGGYMLRKAYDEKYVENQYGVSAENVLIAKNGVTKDEIAQNELDEILHFLTTEDLSVQENYERVAEQIDIQSYLDYFCVNMYLANAEYGMDDLYMWRTREVSGNGAFDGKWRFLIPKLDNSMDNGMAGARSTESIDTYLQEGVSGDIFFRAFLNNDEFKKALRENMQKMADEVFPEDKVNVTLDRISEKMRKFTLSSYKRFSGNVSDTFFSSEVEKIRDFFAARAEYILIYTDEIVDGKITYEDSLREEEMNDEIVETLGEEEYD